MMTFMDAEGPVLRYSLVPWAQDFYAPERWHRPSQGWVPIFPPRTRFQAPDLATLVGAYRDSPDKTWMAMRPILRDLGMKV